MKVRFYCDVPEYYIQGWLLYAQPNPVGRVIEGYKRVAFDVTFPDSVMRQADIAVASQYIGEVADLNELPER
jgi:hypothetical protein